MLKKVYTRLRIDTKYKQSNSDDLYDLGYFTNALRAGTITYEVRISGMGGVKLTDVNGKPTKEVIRTGTFDKHGKSEDVYIGFTCENILEANKSLKAVWTVFLDGFKEWGPRPVKTWFGLSKEGDSVQGHHIPAEWSVAVIEMSDIHSRVRQASGAVNEEITKISKGAGWYLVKQKESYDALINRIFKNPTEREHSVMREINKHLAYSFYQQLQPGQVVIVALEKNNPKVKSMMKEAENAQKVWAEQSRLHSIDATFLMLLDLKLQKHALKTLDSKSFVSEAVGMIDAGKPYVDGTLEFNKQMFERSGSAYEKMMKAASPAFDNATTVGGMTKRGVSAAGQNASKAYKAMDGVLARKLFEWDTGIVADKASDYIRQEARVRHSNYQKGIPNIADEMGKVGKYSKWLKAGGVVGMVVEVGVSGYKFNEAREKGDNKGMITEAGQLAGSLGGGIAGGAIGGGLATAALFVFGVATGGVGLVVLGVFAAGGAYLGGELGKDGAKLATDELNKYVD